MKSEKLYGGGGKPEDLFYFDDITFKVTSKGRDEVVLFAYRGQKVVFTLYINLSQHAFSISMSPLANFCIEHMYALERLLQSRALMHGFSVSQILIPLSGMRKLKTEVEFSGVLEVFPTYHIND